MRFRICNSSEEIIYKRDIMWLQFTEWEDFGYQTTFNLIYFDVLGRERFFGTLKIGRKGMERGSILDDLPKEFTKLSKQYFSLGQDDAYYANISRLNEERREEILVGLRDIAFNLDHFDIYRCEDVVQKSLLRYISTFAVEGQFHRMAIGGARLTNYRFSYTFPLVDNMESLHRTQIEFEVFPESNPPTNIHVLIGRNGSGKTRLLKDMIHSIQVNEGAWRFLNNATENSTLKQNGFANIVCIAFSAFDDFSELEVDDSSIPWSFIGLNKHNDNLIKNIEEQFYSAFTNCMMVSWKRRLWAESIEILKCDPIFAEEEIELFPIDIDIVADENEINKKRSSIINVFSRLSSGHKIVLLIITGCINRIEEQSIVFLDEPENHLHPPLLSALIRALSNLLIDRNGVAIVSTHSPVVLQEVPQKCVWILNRFGQYIKATRPSIQTFGASIGELTRDVFGLEVGESGFHKMLCEMVKRLDNNEEILLDEGIDSKGYEKIVKSFGNQLGSEADLLLRTLLVLRKRGEL